MLTELLLGELVSTGIIPTGRRTLSVIGFAEKLMKNCSSEYYGHIMIGEWDCDSKLITGTTIVEKNGIDKDILQQIEDSDSGYIIIKNKNEE